MKASLIAIGDELLIGQVVDTNSTWIADKLGLIGVGVIEMVSIADDQNIIHKTLGRLLNQCDIVLITGGLGPTKDDITKEALAKYFSSDMYFDKEVHSHILEIYEKLKIDPARALDGQCTMPSKATILENKMGTAPGMWFNEKGKIIISMPGVPYEMKYIMQNSVLKGLEEIVFDVAIVHRTIRTVGMGEVRIASKIEHITDGFPENVKIAFLPAIGQVRLRITARGQSNEALSILVDDYCQQIESELSEIVFGYDKVNLEMAIGHLLLDKKKTLSLAESCTGGFLAHRITTISGSSRYFLGSVVAYSNALKQSLLNVKADTLEKYGAVSEQTVKEMVSGCLNLTKADIAISVSGIAGPGGGTTEKPVGTIWLAIGDKDGISTHKLSLIKNRSKNIEYSSVVALNLLRKYLLNK